MLGSLGRAGGGLVRVLRATDVRGAAGRRHAGGGVHIEPRYRQFPTLTRRQVLVGELLSGLAWFWILWHFWHDPDAVLAGQQPGSVLLVQGLGPTPTAALQLKCIRSQAVVQPGSIPAHAESRSSDADPTISQVIVLKGEGHFPYPDASKWTDEELGIPPDEE